MKKLKIILLYSFIILGIIYVIIINIKKTNFSRYNKETSIIEGKILDYKINGDQLQIKIKAKEKIIVFYKLKTLEEKIYYENNIEIGDIYLFKGILKEPTSNTNFNLFSYKNYLLSNKIYYAMDANNLKLIKKNNNILYKFKNYINHSIRKKKSYPYLLTFLLGDTKEIDNDILTKYRSCGISHLIAISGMHITLFSTILSYLLKWIKNKKISLIIIIIILWLYAFLIEFTPSVTRAVTTFSITSLLKTNNIKFNPINILLIVAICFLIYNPYLIYNTGFLFSYIISFYIVLATNIISKHKNYVIKTFVISLISFLASIPIIGITFYEINILSPIINILFVPFISYIIFPLSLITYFINILEPIYMFFISILEKLIEISNNIFVYKLTIPNMNIVLIIIYYIILTLIIRYKKRYIIALIIILLLHINQKSFKNHHIINVIDVGQGDSLLIELPYNKGNILIDTGGKITYKTEDWKKSKTTTITENILIPTFKSKGIKKINTIIISHGDYDHMGEAINLIENFKVEKVIFNCGEFNELEQNLIKVLDKKKIPYYSCIKELNINDNKLYFLNSGDYGNENDNSSVIYSKLNNYKFLFMGDSSSTTEKEIINIYDLPNIDVLKVGHHGSKTSSSKDFINEINPKYSIISVGKNNRYGHPNKEVLNNLENSKIYRTDKDGSIMFKVKNNKLEIEKSSQ